MNSIFGIGPLELFFIAILALVILGPERLPGAIREGARYFRMLRNMSGELTSQFSEELKALDDINPQKIMKEVMDDLDLEEEKKALNDLNPKKIREDVTSGLNPKKASSTSSAATRKTEAVAATTTVAATATAETTEKTTEEAQISDRADEPVEPLAAQPLAESNDATKKNGAAGDGTMDASQGGIPSQSTTESAAEASEEISAAEPVDILARAQPKMTSNPFAKSSGSRKQASASHPEQDVSADDEPIVENRIAPEELATNIEADESSSDPDLSVCAAPVNGTSHDSSQETPQDSPQDAFDDTPQDNSGDRA
jgi:sec-independent protein translocase protein TatB